MKDRELLSIIEKIFGTKDISFDSGLVTELGLSSFQIMVLICEIEECFAVEIPINEIHNTTKVSDIYHLITRSSDNND